VPKHALSGLRGGDALVEVIASEQRFWDACPCAPLVVAYLGDLLGADAARWEFGKAIVRSRHVSAMYLYPVAPGEEILELWVSATQSGAGGWTLRHSELPRRSVA
jgi:hypothetical protein